MRQGRDGIDLRQHKGEIRITAASQIDWYTAKSDSLLVEC